MNRAVSLDGFTAGPGHAMDWIAEYLPADAFPEVMAATGAMLICRGTHEVAKRMADQCLQRGLVHEILIAQYCEWNAAHRPFRPTQ